MAVDKEKSDVEAKTPGKLWKEFKETSKKETPRDRQRKTVNYILLSAVSLITGYCFMFLYIKSYSGIALLISFFSFFLSVVFSITPSGDFGEGKQGLLFWLVCLALTLASVGSIILLIIVLIPPI